ncbi:TetR/AcrR family transcriptional regulator [Streptomyces sp. NBC_01077]|uniref:TetR/AcrR family transcriptional regulator n=1 Tax=Streptomyces sp. NBC_01077 TaxID=2903746 RepID=UPI00386E2921|nr:TetR/AcrR family transcriptional regulator [Streptomyces sp. NBC_01077]
MGSDTTPAHGAATRESATRTRTRRAILDAAVSVLSADHAASLGDVAEAAGVGRTTVHRYFPERSDLLAAIGADVRDRVAAATDRARLDDGSAPEAMERLCLEFFELGDRLLLLYDVPQFVAWSGIEEETPADLALLALIRRGRQEGTLDPEVDVSWLQDVMWALLYAAWLQARDRATPKHTALSLCVHTLRKAVAP